MVGLMVAGLAVAGQHPSLRRLVAAAEALQCTILDHLVFAGGKCTSLRQLGYL